MRRVAVMVAVLFLVSTPVLAEWNKDVKVVLGEKYLDNDWQDSETGWDLTNQFTYGAMFTFGKADWPVQLAADILYSSDDDDAPLLVRGEPMAPPTVKIDGTTIEYCVGVRKVMTEGAKARPFLGAGLALVDAEVKGSALSESAKVDDSGMGAWIEGGVFWNIGKRFNAGFDLRYSRAELTFEGEKAQSGGFFANVLVGFSF